MAHIELIDTTSVDATLPRYYFGYSNSEVEKYQRDYQKIFLGVPEDLGFEIWDGYHEHYYVVFRGSDHSDYELCHTEKNFLIFNDKNRMLLNLFGKLYRYNISNHTVLSNDIYGFRSGSDHLYQSFSFPEYELMVFIDFYGITAINWENIVWQHDIIGALDCDFTLTEVQDNQLFGITYDRDEKFLLTFDIASGEYQSRNIPEQKYTSSVDYSYNIYDERKKLEEFDKKATRIIKQRRVRDEYITSLLSKSFKK